MAGDNKSLGRFILDGILPAQRGAPQIEVAFDIDADGILHVSATDKGTGKEQKITIQAGSGLSQDEVERMKQDAEAYSEEDRRRKEEVELRNQADSLVYTAEKTVREAGDKMPADVRQTIEERTKNLRDALAGHDGDQVKGSLESLSEAMQKAGSAVYGEPGAGAEAATPSDEPPSDKKSSTEEETVEGEFREV